MDDADKLNVQSTAMVIFLLSLSALSILWTVSCSWLTGKKKRQRVAHNADVEGFVIQMPSLMSRAKNHPPDQYQAAEQIIIIPVDDLGQSLNAPMIIVTPPTPLGPPADSFSTRSDSSIGSAEDLIEGCDQLQNLPEAETKSPASDTERDNCVPYSSMNGVPSGDPLSDSDNISKERGFKKESQMDSQIGGDIIQYGAVSNNSAEPATIKTGDISLVKQDSQLVICQNNNHQHNNNHKHNNNNEKHAVQVNDLDPNFPGPKLTSSMQKRTEGTIST